jgi:hypothetical protein
MPYALYGTFATGRSRPVRISGRWTGSARAVSEQTDPQYIAPFGADGKCEYHYHQVLQVDDATGAAFWDVQARIFQHTEPQGVGDWLCVPTAAISGGFGPAWSPFFEFAGGSDRFAAQYVYIPELILVGSNYYFQYDFDFSGGGDWFCQIDRAEEWFDVYIEVDDLGNPVFPDYGGQRATDTPYSNLVDFYEVIPAGAQVTVGCSYEPLSLAGQVVGVANWPLRITDYSTIGFSRALTRRANAPDVVAESTATIRPAAALDAYVHPLRYVFDARQVGVGVCDAYCEVDSRFGELLTRARTDQCSANPSGVVWTEGVFRFCPRWRYNLKGKVFAMDGGHPDPCRVTVRGASSALAQPVGANPEFGMEDAKRFGLVAAQGFFKASLVYPQPPRAAGIDERGPVACYMTPSGLLQNRDWSRDWRMLQRGMAFDSLTVRQAAYQQVDDGGSLAPSGDDVFPGQWYAGNPASVSIVSGAVSISVIDHPEKGRATRIFNDAVANGNVWSGADFSGYRWLRLRMRGTKANQTFVLALSNQFGEKSWNLAISSPGVWEDLWVDLCCPHSVSETVDAKDSKWPFVGDSTMGHIEDGPLWGVSECDSLVLRELLNVQTYEIDLIRLERREHSRLNLLPAFEHWVDEADDDTDPFIYQARRALWGDTDGRQSLEHPDLRRNLALNDLQLYSIVGMISRINGVLDGRPTGGWSAEAVSPLPADGYHNNNLDAACVWGQGALWTKRPGDGQPRWHVGLDLTAE